MRTVEEFLQNAPKSFVSKVLNREKPYKGLMQASEVQNLCVKWILDSKRITEHLEQMDDTGRKLLVWVYLSGTRGVSEKDILPHFPPSQSGEVQLWLQKFQYHLLIYSRKGEIISWYGFSDLRDFFLKKLIPKSVHQQNDTGPWASFGGYFSAHLSHFLSRTQLGQLKITQQGELHKRSILHIAGKIGQNGLISESIPEEETELIWNFCAGNALLQQGEGQLWLSPRGMEIRWKDGEDIQKEILEWWRSFRLGGDAESWSVFKDFSEQSIPVQDLIETFRFLSGKKTVTTSKTVTWEQLPTVLKEIWLLGIVDFSLQKGKIAYARFSPEMLKILITGHAELHVSPEERALGLPTLECLIPLEAPFEKRYLIELLADKTNDERMTRYKFTRDTVIDGLQAGVTGEQLNELMQWLSMEDTAKQALLTWAESFSATSFHQPLILKVRDHNKWEEFSAIPEFMEWAKEKIPGYGFEIHKECKQQVREFLGHFGLVPGEEDLKNFNPELIHLPLDDATRTSLSGPIEYREKKPSLNHSQKPLPIRPEDEKNPPGKIETLENAKAINKPVELFIQTETEKRRIQVKPLHVLKDRYPAKLIGQDLESGHRNEYLLDSIKKVLILD